MRKLDNKGFTMVELLAVIAILGILSGLGYEAVSKYKEKASDQSYDTMAKTAANAMEEYIMEYGEVNSVTIKDLVDGQYMSPAQDPKDRAKQCKGKVNAIYPGGGNNELLEANSYEVYICCAAGNNYTYTFNSGAQSTKRKDSSCQA